MLLILSLVLSPVGPHEWFSQTPLVSILQNKIHFYIIIRDVKSLNPLLKSL